MFSELLKECLLSSEAWAVSNPVTQHCIPEDLNHQLCTCWKIVQKFLLSPLAHIIILNWNSTWYRTLQFWKVAGMHWIKWTHLRFMCPSLKRNFNCSYSSVHSCLIITYKYLCLLLRYSVTLQPKL
jgi:hypothetical protein